MLMPIAHRIHSRRLIIVLIAIVVVVLVSNLNFTSRTEAIPIHPSHNTKSILEPEPAPTFHEFLMPRRVHRIDTPGAMVHCGARAGSDPVFITQNPDALSHTEHQIISSWTGLPKYLVARLSHDSLSLSNSLYLESINSTNFDRVVRVHIIAKGHVCDDAKRHLVS